MPPRQALRIGIDLGGTKIAVIAFDAEDRILFERRMPTPRHDYPATLHAIRMLAMEAEAATGLTGSIGVAMPGSISPRTGLVQNANSTWLNDKPFDRDVEAGLGRPVRFANDADCLAVSEASDGAARGAANVFAVILGTGCGGGLVVDGRLVQGPNGCAGEWGHMPLPWPVPDEVPGPRCWCGRQGCMETWVSGPALSEDHARRTGERLTGEEIVAASAFSQAAADTLARHASRLARGLAVIVDLCDPDVIVLGGGLSKLDYLYGALPGLIAPHVFASRPEVAVRAPEHGDASGVRGAARLWDHVEPDQD